MATPLYSSQNDTYQVSLYKIANNFYVAALASGFTGVSPHPSSPPQQLLSLIVDYTHFLA